jgi:hypothetical protein
MVTRLIQDWFRRATTLTGAFERISRNVLNDKRMPVVTKLARTML